MTQAPQPVPAGWYPSPDGAPVQRWWDGQMWTTATWPPGPDAQASPAAPATSANAPTVPTDVPATAARAASGWPAPQPPTLGPLALATRVFLALAGIAAPLALLTHAWRGANPPEWLSEDVAQAASGTALGLALVAALFWAWWQYRVARTFPPGTPRRTPGWQVLAWLVPVGHLWLPVQNLADLFRLSTGAAPRWLPVWWALLLGGVLGTALVGLSAWVGLAGGVLLAAATPFAWLIVTRITGALAPRVQHTAPRRAQEAS